MRHLQKQLVYSVATALRRGGFYSDGSNNPQVTEMHDSIASVGGAIEFVAEQQPDGHWSALSTNVDGIMTGGDDPRQIPSHIKDAIFTYYEVPPQYCNDALLRGDNEPVRVEQRVHVGA